MSETNQETTVVKGKLAPGSKGGNQPPEPPGESAFKKRAPIHSAPRAGETQDHFVGLTIPVESNREEQSVDTSEVPVGHKGRSYKLPRGRKIPVPEGVVDTLKTANITKYDPTPRIVGQDAKHYPDMTPVNEWAEFEVKGFPNLTVEELTEEEYKNAPREFESFRVKTS